MIIYKTTNLINGKFYIGKDLYNNSSYFGSGILLKNAILKYGINNFKKEILEYCECREFLNDREKYWISHLKSQDRSIGYNIHSGGDGGDTFSGKHHSDESKEKSSKSNKLTWSNPELRKKTFGKP
jgi:group I intron endonuclease